MPLSASRRLFTSAAAAPAGMGDVNSGCVVAGSWPGARKPRRKVSPVTERGHDPVMLCTVTVALMSADPDVVRLPVSTRRSGRAPQLERKVTAHVKPPTELGPARLTATDPTEGSISSAALTWVGSALCGIGTVLCHTLSSGKDKRNVPSRSVAAVSAMAWTSPDPPRCSSVLAATTPVATALLAVRGLDPCDTGHTTCIAGVALLRMSLPACTSAAPNTLAG